MKTITMTQIELQHLLEDTVKKTLSKIITDKDLFFNLLEDIEDAGLGKLIEKGMVHDLVDESIIFKKLHKIKDSH